MSTDRPDAAKFIALRDPRPDGDGLIGAEDRFGDATGDLPGDDPSAAGLPDPAEDVSADPAASPDLPVRTVEEQLGMAVLRLRLYRGWSQRDVQRGSGVHQSQISRLETGRQAGLSIRRLFAILRVLHVGEITFRPPAPATPPTQLELLLWGGDPWERAGRSAERRRVNRRRIA